MLSVKEQEFDIMTAEEWSFVFNADQNYWRFGYNMLIEVNEYF
jgi:hypothetical protein